MTKAQTHRHYNLFDMRIALKQSAVRYQWPTLVLFYFAQTLFLSLIFIFFSLFHPYAKSQWE